MIILIVTQQSERHTDLAFTSFRYDLIGTCYNTELIKDFIQ